MGIISLREETIKMTEEEISLDEVAETLKVIMGKGREEALAEAIEQLGSEEKILLFTEIEKREVPLITLKKVIAKRYKLNWLDDYVDTELKLRVSIKRRGRNELVKVVVGVKKSIEEKVKGLFRRKKVEEID